MVLKIPNPSDWLTVAQAADIMEVSHQTVHAMMGRGVLCRYHIGDFVVLWRAEVLEVRDARRRAGKVPR